MLTLLLTLLAATQGSPGNYWGTIKVVDRGAERIPAGGWIDFCVVFGPVQRVQRVPIVDGKWRLEVDPSESVGAPRAPYLVDPGPIEVDGRPAVPEFGSYALREPGRYDLLVQRVPRSTLRVLDAETGVALREVEVFKMEGEVPSPWSSGSSPVDVSTPECSSNSFWEASATFLVCASGYLPETIDVRLSRGGVFEVPLRSVGDLVVYAVPEARSGALELEVLSAMYRTVLRDGVVLRRVQPAIVTGLGAGTYVAVVRSGDEVVHEQPVRVVAGRDTVITLPKEKLIGVFGERSDPPSLRGTISVPEAYGASRITLQVGRIEPSTGPLARWPESFRVPLEESRPFAWQLESFDAHGAFIVTIPEIPWAFVWDGDREYALPEPAEVTVRFVAAGTFEELPVRTASWRILRPTTFAPELPAQQIVADDTGRIRFKAPAGELVVEGVHRGFRRTSRRVRVVPGENAVVFGLRR